MSDVQERLVLAVQLTRDADAKASGLLSGAGVLAAVAALTAGAVDVSGPVDRVGLCVAGAGLVTALVVLLATLAPRGGRRPGWVQATDPVDELDRVSEIVRQKHVLLRVAVVALTVVVLAAAVVAAVALAGAW